MREKTIFSKSTHRRGLFRGKDKQPVSLDKLKLRERPKLSLIESRNYSKKYELQSLISSSEQEECLIRMSYTSKY